MININVYKKEAFITKLTIQGHSNFANKGQDIVCAGVSAIAFGIMNYVEKNHLNLFSIQKLDNKIQLEIINESSITRLIMEIFISQLELVEDQYDDFVKISYNN